MYIILDINDLSIYERLVMKPLKYRRLPKWSKRIIWRSRILLDPSGLAKATNKLRHSYNDHVKNPEIWKRTFRQLIKSGLGYDQYIEDFYNVTIEQHTTTDLRGDISLICIVKNDLSRVRILIEYYRHLGIQHFIMLDDNSSDGTREFLLSQDDVDLWSSNSGYTTSMRQAWVSRLIDIYGFNKWYLVVDSDEFLTYPNYENIPLPLIVKAMHETGIKRAHCFLLDMYSKNGLFFPYDEDEFMEEYSYFDKSGYQITDRTKLTNLSGGMRVRLFSFNSFFLSKSPLFYAEPGFAPCNSHYSFPFSSLGEELNLGVLRHYKFLPQDREKYSLRIKQANFSSGSSEYSTYMDEYQQTNDSIYDESISMEFQSSKSLEVLELPTDSKIDFSFIERINQGR